jgi:hypothetical protein
MPTLTLISVGFDEKVAKSVMAAGGNGYRARGIAAPNAQDLLAQQ